jgi:hypothetical protein
MSKFPGELTPFTFKDTGINIKIRKVSSFLVNELNKLYPAPKPPMQEVDYGDGKVVMEPNEAHPNYIQTMADYQNLKMEQLKKLLVRRGVECEVDTEAVQELRDYWRAEYGKELEGTDKEIYIFYICAGTDKDADELMEAILRRSQPTKEAVELAKVTFPGKV